MSVLSRTCSLILSLALLSLGVACSTTPKKQKAPTQKTVRTISHTTAGGATGGPLDQSAPTDAELASSPCSNPDWAKPPPGGTAGGKTP